MTQRSDRIEKLMEDPDLIEAFDSVEKMYHDMLDAVPLNTEDATPLLLDIHRNLHALKSVKKTLMKAIQTGHLEDFNALEQTGALEDKMHGKPN